MMLLTLHVHRGKIAGELTQPQHLTEDWNGDFSGISLPIITLPATEEWNGNHVELSVGSKPDEDKIAIKLGADHHLLVARFNGLVPDWKFDRVSPEQRITVYADWPAYDVDSEIVQIRHQLRTMADADKQARENRPIDQKEINKLADESRPFLQQVYSGYGWPKISIFGAQASDDFWLLVQHQTLAVQEQMLPAMKVAVDADEATKRNYAYLFDRVEVGRGKPQHWGTQSRCENEQAVLFPVDEISHLEQRRKQIGLEPLAESLKAAAAICRRLPY